MIRSLIGLAVKDPASAPVPFERLWLKRNLRTVAGSAAMALLGLGLMALGIKLRAWNSKDPVVILTFPGGLLILALYSRSIFKKLKDPLLALAKSRDRCLFSQGEIFDAEEAWDNFGMGRHRRVSLRFTDSQGQPRELAEHFSLMTWIRICPSLTLSSPIPAWIVYDRNDPKTASFLGLPENPLGPASPNDEFKLFTAFNIVIMLLFFWLGSAVGGALGDIPGGLLGGSIGAALAVCWLGILKGLW